MYYSLQLLFYAGLVVATVLLIRACNTSPPSLLRRAALLALSQAVLILVTAFWLFRDLFLYLGLGALPYVLASAVFVGFGLVLLSSIAEFEQPGQLSHLFALYVVTAIGSGIAFVALMPMVVSGLYWAVLPLFTMTASSIVCVGLNRASHG
jgi:hypothetical protein